MADPARCVTQAYLVEGRNRVRVYEPKGTPPPAFAPVAPTLEDAYLVSIKTGCLPIDRRADRLGQFGERSGRRLTPVTSEVGHELEIEAATCAVQDGVPGRSDLSRSPSTVSRCGHLSSPVTALGLSSGNVRIVSGDASVGGTKAHITSEFALAMQLAIFTTLFYAFFISVAAGMTIIQDEEWRLGDLLHATPLRTREYIWAKFAAVLVGCLVILGIHLAATAFFFHVLPDADAAGIPRRLPRS